MKTFLALTILLTFSAAHACLGEAQITGRIIDIKKQSFVGCKAFVDVNHIQFYSANMTCPLDLSEIAASGIEIGFKDGHDCRLEIGDQLSGTVVKNSAEILTLE